MITMKTLYNTVTAMINTFDLTDFRLEFRNPNYEPSHTACDADYFVAYYRARIKGTAYENARVFDIARIFDMERNNGRIIMRVGVNGKVVAQLFNDPRKDAEWYYEHIPDLFVDKDIEYARSSWMPEEYPIF